MPLTTIGAEFERIRMTQGEAAALAFIRTGMSSEPVTVLGLPASSVAEPFVNQFGTTGTLQQVFNFASRINRDRLIAQQRIEASIAETRIATLAGFRAVAARLGRM